MVKSENHLSLSPEQDTSGLHCRLPVSSLSLQIKTQRISPIHEARLSSHRSIHSLSRECDSSPQRERESSSIWRSRNIITTPSPVPALSPLSDAGSYSNSSIDHSGSTTGKPETPDGQKTSTCGGGLVSATLQAEINRRKSTSESSHSSVMSETGSPPAKNGGSKSNSRVDRNKNGHLGKDVTQLQSLSSCCLTYHSSQHSESSGKQGQAKRSQPASIQLNGQLFT